LKEEKIKSKNEKSPFASKPKGASHTYNSYFFPIFSLYFFEGGKKKLSEMKQMLGIAAADDYSSFLSLRPEKNNHNNNKGNNKCTTHISSEIYLSFLYVDLRV
jgi:hypothetical protein